MSQNPPFTPTPLTRQPAPAKPTPPPVRKVTPSRAPTSAVVPPRKK